MERIAGGGVGLEVSAGLAGGCEIDEGAVWLGEIVRGALGAGGDEDRVGKRTDGLLVAPMPAEAEEPGKRGRICGMAEMDGEVVGAEGAGSEEEDCHAEGAESEGEGRDWIGWIGEMLGAFAGMLSEFD